MTVTPEREREIRAWAAGPGRDMRALTETLDALTAANARADGREIELVEAAELIKALTARAEAAEAEIARLAAALAGLMRRRLPNGDPCWCSEAEIRSHYPAHGYWCAKAKHLAVAAAGAGQEDIETPSPLDPDGFDPNGERLQFESAEAVIAYLRADDCPPEAPSDRSHV